MVFVFSLGLFLMTHRHNCFFWVRAAHQLPPFIDPFIFIYVFRKKQGAQFVVLCPESSSGDFRLVHLDGEKDLEEHWGVGGKGSF